MGSPLFAMVHKVGEEGIWLETRTFPLCPSNVKKEKTKSGQEVCLAHIFIPLRCIVSVVAFPEKTSAIEADPKVHKIGFRPKPDKKRRRP